MDKPELGSDGQIAMLKSALVDEVRLNLIFQERIDVLHQRIDYLVDEVEYYQGRERIMRGEEP